MKTVIVIPGTAGIKPPALQNLAEPARPARHRLGGGALRALGAGRRSGRRPARYPARRSACPPLAGAGRQHLPGIGTRRALAYAWGRRRTVRISWSACAPTIPLIWGGEIDNLIRFYQREHTAGNCDYAYNHIPRNNLYPDGLGAEIVSFELFTKAMNEATLPAHREHCLSYIVDNPELFAIRTFDPLDPALHHPEMKLDMDTADDFINLALRDIRPDITPREIVELFR